MRHRLRPERAGEPESQTRRHGNATYALVGRSGNNKRIVTRVGTASPDRAKITVGDHGVGIVPDDMTRVFNHGFTTKKNGHGFGLHSGANGAKEMGGTFTAHSDGAGKGAEFTLNHPRPHGQKNTQPHKGKYEQHRR